MTQPGDFFLYFKLKQAGPMGTPDFPDIAESMKPLTQNKTIGQMAGNAFQSIKNVGSTVLNSSPSQLMQTAKAGIKAAPAAAMSGTPGRLIGGLAKGLGGLAVDTLGHHGAGYIAGQGGGVTGTDNRAVFSGIDSMLGKAPKPVGDFAKGVGAVSNTAMSFVPPLAAAKGLVASGAAGLGRLTSSLNLPGFGYGDGQAAELGPRFGVGSIRSNSLGKGLADNTAELRHRNMVVNQNFLRSSPGTMKHIMGQPPKPQGGRLKFTDY